MGKTPHLISRIHRREPSMVKMIPPNHHSKITRPHSEVYIKTVWVEKEMVFSRKSYSTNIQFMSQTFVELLPFACPGLSRH